MNILRSATSVIIVFVFVTVAAGVPVQERAVSIPDIEYSCENVFGAKEDEDNNCVCENEGYIIDSGYSHCIPVLYDGYKTACNETRQCLDRMKAGASCAGGICACADGYHYLHGVCWRSKKYGDACTKDEECYAFYESDAYKCESGKCACAAGAYTHRTEGNFLCRRNAGENEECESTMDCQENGLICMQPKDQVGYVCQTKKTSEDKVVDFAGKEDVYASIGTSGAETTKESNCAENEEESPFGKCICSPGYFRKSATADCLPELGTACTLTENRTTDVPHIQEAICRRSAKFEYNVNNAEGVWSCLGGFIPNVNNRECIGLRSVGLACPMGDVHCAYYGATCVSKICQCPQGFHYVAEKHVCWPTKALHQACTEDADCGVSTADSTLCFFDENHNGKEGTGTCKCIDNYHEAGSDCRPDAKALGDECKEPSDCTFANDDPKITCTSNKCACKTGTFQVDNTTCVVGVGGDCTSDSDCKNVKDSYCLDEKCVCDTGFVGNNNRSLCLPVTNEYGGVCQEVIQCNSTTNIEEMECTTSKCLCKTDHHFVENFCWDTKKLNVKCTHPNQCVVENSICLNSFCTCNFGYKQVEEKCDNGAQIAWPVSPILALALTICVSILR